MSEIKDQAEPASKAPAAAQTQTPSTSENASPSPSAPVTGDLGQPLAESAPAAAAVAPAKAPVRTAAKAPAKPVRSAARARAASKVADEKVVLQILPMAQPAKPAPRHRGLLYSFLIIVLLPLIVTLAYLETFAKDQYGSTLAFTVRSEELTSATDLLGGMGAAFGGGGSKDSDILYEFIRSQEMVSAVDAKLDLRRLYTSHTAFDPVFGLAEGASIEELTRYWVRMVPISYDSNSGLLELQALAFTPEDAQAIAKAIYEESTKRINSLSEIARSDALRYASEDLEVAVERLKGAREAITAFRLQHRIVDVNADIQGQMGLLNTLQSQLAAALIEYDLLRQSARESDPRLDQAQLRIKVIQERIAEERDKFGGTVAEGASDSYATTVAEFERLTVDREFAEASYLASLQALDAAKAEANRQNRYLATYIQPTLAQISEYPQNLLILALVGLFSFLFWVIGSLVFYALRDRH